MKKSRIILALLICLSLMATAFMFGSCGGDTTTEENTEETTAVEETTAAETEAPRVNGFEITTPPTKTEYNVGEELDLTGMVCTVTYDDGTTAEYTDYKVSIEGPLKVSDTEVTIRYSSRYRDSFEIRVVLDLGFAGSGTYEDPYLISTASELLSMLEATKETAGTSSHDVEVYGKGLYFKQTADIDLGEYAGTNANGNAKYGFAGVYDGCGYTIKFNIKSSDSETSLFPYLNGVIMNTKFQGVMNTSGTAQPIRTVGQNGAILNCLFDDQLTSGTVRGVTQTLYGLIENVYVTGSISTGALTVYGTNSNDGVTGGIGVNAFENLTNASGAEITGNGIKKTDVNEVVTLLNDTTAASYTNMLDILKKYNEGYTADSILKFQVVENAVEFVK